MKDTYICSADLQGLELFCQSFTNFLGPRPGIMANPDEGLKGAGDVDKHYACIRAPFAIPDPIHTDGWNDYEIVDPSVGVKILGSWFDQ